MEYQSRDGDEMRNLKMSFSDATSSSMFMTRIASSCPSLNPYIQRTEFERCVCVCVCMCVCLCVYV